MALFRRFIWALIVLAASLVYGQEYEGYETFHPNLELRVPGLHRLKARSHDRSDVLLTSLDVVFNDPDICCGKNSALEDRATAANPLSLNEVASKIQGRWLLSDGRPIQVKAEILGPTPSLDISYRIIGALRNKHALLLEWNSHLYVLYGAVFDEADTSEVVSSYMIHKLLLVDTRYSDFRRYVTFNRDTDDWGRVQGLLLLSATAQ
jgi:hypothetical protein